MTRALTAALVALVVLTLAFLAGARIGAHRAAVRALEAYQATSEAIDNVEVPVDPGGALAELCRLAGRDDCPVQRNPE